MNRIARFAVLPSIALNVFNADELSNLLRALSGPRISGSKIEKIESLIDYYEDITRPTASDPTDHRSQYYDLFDELARRDYKTLRGSDSISKDLDIEHYFEEATNYLFEKKLGILPERFEGNKHADGRLKHNTKQVVLWDNKSTELPYSFPDEHLDQFLGYIRADIMQPLAFLVIVFDCTQEAVAQAQRLKYYSRTDTDVALIRARDLKFVAENWQKYSDKKSPEFNLEVFNRTGVLDEDILKNRMNLVLGGN